MKLKIQKVSAPTLVEKAKITKTGYEHPVGWWTVTTEGDEEGRTTRNLGVWYGHVAEIALHLANEACHEIEFNPNKDQQFPPTQYPKYQAKRNLVRIGLGICSNTWDLKGDARIKWWTNWLDTNDVKVEDGYYKSVLITMV